MEVLVYTALRPQHGFADSINKIEIKVSPSRTSFFITVLMLSIAKARGNYTQTFSKGFNQLKTIPSQGPRKTNIVPLLMNCIDCFNDRPWVR